MRFFDASALVKRYTNERGSAEVERLLDSEAAAISRLSEVEVASALERLLAEGLLKSSDRDRALATLELDLLTLRIVELTAEVTTVARNLLSRHRLRANDAIQLASCLWLQRELRESIPFTGFDNCLNRAAVREGLTTT